MTEFQVKQIRELRLRGVGYRSIASLTGLSRDIVRNYCKAHGLEGLASDLTLNMKEQMALGKVCLSCGRKLIQPAVGRKKKFCKDTCRRDWWSQHPEKINRSDQAYYEKSCGYCGENFSVYGDTHRKYCSHSCYVKDRFWNEEDSQ